MDKISPYKAKPLDIVEYLNGKRKERAFKINTHSFRQMKTGLLMNIDELPELVKVVGYLKICYYEDTTM